MKTHSFDKWFYLSVLAQVPAILAATIHGNIYFLIGLIALYIGALGNCAAIYFNNQKMPVAELKEPTPLHELVGTHTRLTFLCDIIRFNCKWFSGYASIGDVLIAAGMAMAIAAVIMFKP